MKAQRLPLGVGVALTIALQLASACSTQAPDTHQPAEAGPVTSITDIANDQSDPNNLADTEPSIAVNPTNLNDIAVVAFSGNWGPGTRAPIWRSRDGGKTWNKDLTIPQIGANLSGPADQKIAFTASGRLVVAELGVDQQDAIQDRILKEHPGQPPELLSAAYGNDQPHVDVDRTSGGSCFERIYSPWLDTNASKSMVTFSSNTDLSLTDTVVGTSFPNRTTRIAVADTGKAYVLYKTREAQIDSNFERAHFRVKRSDNCGAAWNAVGGDGVSVHGDAPVVTYFTTSFGNPAKGKVARARSSDGWVAANAGVVAAAYVNRDSSGHAQIYVALSADDGRSWTTHRVSDGQTNAAFPEIAIASDKAVGVLYIDYDDSGAQTLFRHHFAKSSNAGGQWADEILQVMNPSDIENADSGYLWGDYEGLTAGGANFYGVFTGESINRATKQLDPIFFKR
jgi:photosystem II stability/assembly factor-like uncharacterized protein